MDRVNSLATSQYSDDEEAEKFPEDHFDSDDDSLLYDSEFGSVIHEVVDNDAEERNHPEAIENRNLTTITEESVNQFVEDIHGFSFNNLKSAKVSNDYSFKPASQCFSLFEEDQRRVEEENRFALPDHISDSMLKKQHSWEPSILTSPPLIQNKSHSVLRSTENFSSPKRPTQTNSRMESNSNFDKIMSEIYSKLGVQLISSVQPKSSSSKIVVEETQQESSNTSSFKQVDFITPESKPENIGSEEKENLQTIKTPKKTPDFSETVVSIHGHAFSTPKEAREVAKNELSMLCHSISTIGGESPKVRPKKAETRNNFLKFKENSKLGVTRTIMKPGTETLSSTVIDRALSDPTCNTIISDATEIQFKLVNRIMRQGTHIYRPKNRLVDLKNQLERQINTSYQKRMENSTSRKYPRSTIWREDQSQLNRLADNMARKTLGPQFKNCERI